MERIVDIRFLFCFLITPFLVLGQSDSINAVKRTSNWFKENQFQIRQTFDGSKNEGRPARITFFENHESSNDFFKADIGVKIKEWELLGNSPVILTVYPVLEWHKSSDEDNENDKLSLGLNQEFYFWENLPVRPFFLSNLALKRNFLNGQTEFKLLGQFSFLGSKNGHPGVDFVAKNGIDFKGRWYPYLGYELYNIPNLVNQGETETVSLLYIRGFIEYWFVTQQLQFVFDGTYRNLFKTVGNLEKNLPLVSFSLNFYPGKQEVFGIGINYKKGHDPDLNFAEIEVSSLSLTVKY